VNHELPSEFVLEEDQLRPTSGLKWIWYKSNVRIDEVAIISDDAAEVTAIKSSINYIYGQLVADCTRNWKLTMAAAPPLPNSVTTPAGAARPVLISAAVRPPGYGKLGSK
jgi:hypothetical protein